MFVSGWKWKTRKINNSVKENTNRKRKKNKEKNMDRSQAKLNSPHIMYNVKVLSQ